MATKKNTADKTVTRIKASSSPKTKTPASKKTKKPAAKNTKVTVATKSKATDQPVRRRRNPLAPITGYFVGSWQELKQVHWPTRKATWGLTLAVLLYSAFFVVLILLLDALFKYLFELVLG